MEALPTDILLGIFDVLDRAGKASFSLCNKFYFSLFKGQETLRQLRQESSQLASFLLSLERDLPIENLFCPTCLRFHQFGISPESIGAPLKEELAPNSDRLASVINNFDNRYKCWWFCMMADWRNEISLIYGPKLKFCQARMALKLHSAKNSHAQEYLRSLDLLKPETKDGSVFFRRQMRVIPEEEGHFPQLFMRLQQWWLVSKHDLKKNRLMIVEGRQDPLLCYHRTDYYFEIDSKFGHFGAQAQRLVRALANAVDEDEKSLRDDFSFKSLTKLKKTYNNGAMHGKMQTASTDNDNSVTIVSPEHRYCPLTRCARCSTDFRLEVIHFPKSSRPPKLSMLDERKEYAIVLTKWMNLGNMSAQNSREWQGHAFSKAHEHLVQTSKLLQRGEVMRSFEGQAEYRPEWSSELETTWKEELKSFSEAGRWR